MYYFDLYLFIFFFEILDSFGKSFNSEGFLDNEYFDMLIKCFIFLLEYYDKFNIIGINNEI